MPIDTYQHKGMRKQLIEQLKTKGISDESVLQAMNTIPRHFFLDSAFDKYAYQDSAFPIGQGQTISQPYTVAFQSQLLQVKKNDKILEVGTGSMYQTTILAALGARVFTIERQKKLYLQHQRYPYKKEYFYIKFFYGDGFEGLPQFAPFDKILITAAAPHVPITLKKQLKINGCIVLPLQLENSTDKQMMLRLTKLSEDDWTQEQFHECSFVPMLKGKESGEL